MTRCLPVALLLLQGCVTVYQPLVSLQRPVVVDPQVPNLEGVTLKLRCLPTEHVEVAEAQALCVKTTRLFSNQGALVRSEVPRDGRGTSSRDESDRPDLVVELETKLVHREENALLAALSGMTLTIVPFVKERTYSQEVTIRDGDGALLASDTLQARFVEYFGIGVWGVNWVLDALVRDDHEEVTGDGAKLDFSRDLYGQLSQLVFNAHVRSRVLRGFAPTASATANTGG